jgi:hypothetical protein
MATGIRIQRLLLETMLLGTQAMVQTHCRSNLLNGQTKMAMAMAIMQVACFQMPAPQNMASQTSTFTGALMRTMMVLPKAMIPSLTIQHNGKIWTAMALATIQMEAIRMHV